MIFWLVSSFAMRVPCTLLCCLLQPAAATTRRTKAMVLEVIGLVGGVSHETIGPRGLLPPVGDAGQKVAEVLVGIGDPGQIDVGDSRDGETHRGGAHLDRQGSAVG